jgi:RNA recognition motif-containing protein
VDKRIYIGGLHATTTEDQIKDRFSKFGSVTNVTIAKNTDSMFD